MRHSVLQIDQPLLDQSLVSSESIIVAEAIARGTFRLRETFGDAAFPEWFTLPGNKHLFEIVRFLEDRGAIINERIVLEELGRRKLSEHDPAKIVFPSAMIEAGKNPLGEFELIKQEAEKLRRAYTARMTATLARQSTLNNWDAATLRDKLAPIEFIDEKGRTESSIDRIEVIQASDLITREIDDSQTLLGNRYLCRGKGMFLVGPSGVGKSTMTLGLASAMGAGVPYLGIKPSQKLKVLIVQAENDDGDMIEQLRGAFGSSREGIENICFAVIDHLNGEPLMRVLAQLIAKHKPDILILDCLHAYLGDDPKEIKALSYFLRDLLNPLLRKTGVGVIVVHHTPKTTNQDRTNWNPSDFQYAAAGSAEIANWARAILVLDATAVSDVFRLVAAKRGSRLDDDIWRNGWIPVRHSRTEVIGGEVPLKWEIADEVDLDMIREAAAKKKAARQSYQCTAGHFIDCLPDAGNGIQSCIKSSDLRSILMTKKLCSKDGFAGLKATYIEDGIINVHKIGTTEWVGRREDIEEVMQGASVRSVRHEKSDKADKADKGRCAA